MDDDPRWLRPTSSYGYEKVVDRDADLPILKGPSAAATAAVQGREPVRISPGDAKYTAQDHVRLDVLNHYVNGTCDEQWDRDGWFGNDHPVVTPWKDGYVVLDGVHRVAADRVAGRGPVPMYVVPNSRYDHPNR
jgi:hypothetical protein